MGGAGSPVSRAPDGAEKIGGYEVLAELGRGAMGVVYKAYDRKLDRLVAVKTLRRALNDDDDEDQTTLKRFEREAFAAGRLNHQGIVAMYDFGVDDGCPFMAMEYVEGRTLKELLEPKQPLPLDQTVRLMAKLLDALAYAHETKTVHRDIKPANIMVTPTGEPKVMDFGVARVEDSTLTRAGDILGTPAYMSPEQIFGQSIDQRADLFSCGIMLYEMLVGVKPFRGSPSQVLQMVLNETPPAPSTQVPGLPEAFDAVVAKAIAKRREQRYQDARAFREALILAHGSTMRVPAPSGEPTSEIVPLSQRRAPRARLLCLDCSVLRDAPRSFEIALAAEVEHVVGREKGVNGRIDSPVVSRRHARVFPGDGCWGVEDLNSTNGVYVNGQRVSEARLDHNDIVRFGPAAFRYEVL